MKEKSSSDSLGAIFAYSFDYKPSFERFQPFIKWRYLAALYPGDEEIFALCIFLTRQ